jgi:hypothetical protein
VGSIQGLLKYNSRRLLLITDGTGGFRLRSTVLYRSATCGMSSLVRGRKGTLLPLAQWCLLDQLLGIRLRAFPSVTKSNSLKLVEQRLRSGSSGSVLRIHSRSFIPRL